MTATAERPAEADVDVTGPLPVDLALTPFSRRGSYYAVTVPPRAPVPGVYLRNVHGSVAHREVLRFDLGGGVPDVEVAPGLLVLRAASAEVHVALSEAGRAHVRVMRGAITLELQVLDKFDVVVPLDARTWRFVDAGANQNYLLRVLAGDAAMSTDWDGERTTRAELRLDARSGPVTLVVDEHRTAAPTDVPADLDAVAQEAGRDYEAWLRQHTGTGAGDPVEDAARLAAYVTWSALVPAGGQLVAESMLMSKNWMTNIWSWDLCFNAMALWRDPQAAASHLLGFFAHQDESGGLPDYVNDTVVERNFVKPPIHGWTVGWLLDRDALAPEAVAALYEPLARWTRWWFEHRVHSGDGVPSYHHGNDCGWDNSTVFGEVVPVQSPDLLAFLAIQQETLGRMADRLGLPADAAVWREQASATVDRLLAHFWVGGRFIARETHSGAPITVDSLLTLMPVVLGPQLPAEVFDACVERLTTGGYLTEHGVATEPVGSAPYEPDGYWRGPIWAPTMMLLVDGLARGGRVELAQDLAARFVATCAASGMAENFDAVTGAGLRDRSMTWTASVYLLLTHATPSAPVVAAAPGGARA
ncbi:amylo-alpha-1,6-glucosidase [Cellulomonas sp. C5510]|uniref:amylo-alpha-1,6-glucosidase n=1 Tax=Cellulomonas sp. C5510 TaxID=2871170 RepID=UPI001C93BDBF|nr:trehalase family glycosidase [Cellulomonas sp. C5510]QZN85398.1 glycogen debranching protein [Cellulomonas sp. C5510]